MKYFNFLKVSTKNQLFHIRLEKNHVLKKKTLHHNTTRRTLTHNFDVTLNEPVSLHTF